MTVVILVFALLGCMGLFAALRPEAYSRYLLAEYQRRALSGNFKVISFIGWIIFAICLAVVLAIPFQSRWRDVAPIASPFFLLVCAVAYAWWGVGLVRKPASFLEQAAAPWNRLPVRGVQGIGALLIFGACGFLYAFIRTTVALLQ
jgi:hypothetical protein